MTVETTGKQSGQAAGAGSKFIFPTTFAQQRLWFLDQLQPGSTTYLVPWWLRIEGPLNVDALCQSLNEIIRRHEVLRTTFSSKDGAPVQVVGDFAALDLPIVDVSGDANPTHAAEELAREEARTPLDLERPLVRAKLIRLASQEHTLLLTMHHIIFDGWSRRILVQELSALYEAFCSGRPSPLPKPKLQYADYAVWQRKQLQGANLQKQLSYWREQLASAPSTLELPTDRPRPAVQTFNGATEPITFSKELTEELHHFSREQGVTLYMTLLTGFQILLSRYSHQEDICVGSPIANRNRAELEGMIGFFANTLVMRTKLPSGASFKDVLAQVKETSLGAYAHQDVPFEKLVEELRPDRNLSQNPLFQVLFSLQNAPRKAFELSGLKVAMLDSGERAAKFDISAFLLETADGINGRLEYNTDLFDADTIRRMIGHYEVLLRSAIQSPATAVSALQLLTEEERQTILQTWNATVADYPRDLCLHQLIEQQAERTPEAIACIEPRDGEPDRTINYRELNGRANQLAHFLRRNGIGAKQKVGIYIDRSLEMMIGLLGIQKSGAAYIPLDPAYPAERVRMTLEDAQPAIVVTRQSLCDSLPSSSATVICIDSDWTEISRESEANLPSVSTPDDLVYIIFTSGSTGRPKGVQVRHRGVVNLLTSMSKTLNMGPGDVFPALASFAFDMCIPELYLALVSGGQVVIGKRGLAANGEELSALLRRLGATVVHATPTTWNLLLEAGFDGKGLKRVIGAEPLPEELRRRLLEADDSLYNFYGPTETTVWSTFHRFRSVDEPVVVGRPLANTQVYIFDKELQPVPIGVFGEILIGGDGVAAGYLNQPDLTASKFIADPFAITQDATLYKTGDLGRFLPDGRIEFQGRADYQIKIRGYRIELGDIESTLAKHPAVQECAVIAREDVPGDKRLVGYVITAAGEFDPADLRAWIKARLPEHMVPAAFVQLSRLPLSPAGKVDRKSLPAPEYTRPELESKFESPRNSTEETIAEIWAGVLKLARVGIHDNFFELGGHSLLATQVVSRLRQAFSVELPLRAIFEAPTIAGLSDKVQQLKSETNPALAVPLKPVPRNQPLPLSFAQQRLWFLDKLEPDNALYNVPVIMRLKGALQATALRKALNRVVARHESLRTRFAMHDGVPTQAIASNLEIELSTTSVMFVPERVRETEARRLVLAEIERPFNLEAGPLIRAVLVKLSDVDHVLVLNTHHIISDRWSLGVLEDELSEFYEQEVRGEIRELAPLPVQYADYAVWQQQILSGATLEEQLTYWRQQLSGAPASLDLATDRSRPAEQSFRGAKYTFEVPRDLTDKLQAIGRHENATLFMTLLAAFNILLSRYSGQDDVVVGSPIAGRTRPELEKLIGFFVNTLVLRTHLSSDASFRDLLAQVKETAMGAYAHQDVPFEKLVEELKPERDLSRNPLFQVMFILQNVPTPRHAMGGIEIGGLPLATASSKFDLTLISAERDGVRLTFEYNTDLFDLSTIERMAEHFQTLLAAVAAKPAARISDLPLLGQAERNKLLVEWNATASDYPRVCVHELFAQQAARTPNAVAVEMGSEKIRYAELNARADLLAQHLRAEGVGPEKLVGIYLERSIEMVVALLAVLKAGAAYIPLDPAYPPERIGFILDDAGVEIVLTESDLLASVPPTQAKKLDVRALLKSPAPNNAPAATASRPENLAYVLYTSGSTGKPKGVQITHANLVNFLASMQREPGLTADDTLLAVTTLSFDIAGLEIYLPLTTGARILLATRAEASDGRLLLEQIGLRRPTVMQATPATWRMLIEAGWQGTKNLKVLCGGEALPADLAALLLPRCSELWNMYGPTETTIWSSVYRVREVNWTAAPVGRPIANTQMYVLDANGRPTPIGVPGELYIAGDGVARGYFRRPELTAEKFLHDPFSAQPDARMYRTGDLARFLPDGNIQYLGRTDFQVKIRGFRIELGEIESLLAQHPAVQQTVVAAREDSPGDKRLVAYIVPKSGEHLSTTDARAYLRQNLPDYMLPSVVMELEALPLTPNGKVDRKALPKPEVPVRDAQSLIPPRDALESQLLEIWKKILQTQSIGITDNFFDLGGHSIMAARLVMEMEKAVGRKIPLAALFRGPSVESMANLIREGTEAAPDPIVMQIQAGTSIPFFAVVEPGMDAVGYIALAQAMGQQQTFYKLQSHRPMKPDTPITLDDMRGFAREYIKAMQTIQPRGPYFIGGMCAGTHIAEQMVLQLEAEGEKVALFAVFDTWVRQNTQIRWKWLIYYYRQRLRGLVRLGLKQQLAMVRGAITKKVRRFSTPFARPIETSWAKLYWPGKEFKTPLFEAPVALFKRPRQPFYYLRDEAMGWGERSLGGVHIYRIDFPHRMLRDPYVRELARRLLACIAGASSPSRLERLQVWPTVSETQPSHSDTHA